MTYNVFSGTLNPTHFTPEKSHPCLEPHLLTYFVSKAVGWIKNQKIAESTLVPMGQGSETGESLLGNI